MDTSARTAALHALIEAVAKRLPPHFDLEWRLGPGMHELWAHRRDVRVELVLRTPTGLSLSYASRGWRDGRFSEDILRWDGDELVARDGGEPVDAVLKIVGELYREARARPARGR